jgi:hypothetical protein
MKEDMSKECGFKDAEMYYAWYENKISQEEYDLYWNKYCGKCIHMCDICMCGEEPDEESLK